MGRRSFRVDEDDRLGIACPVASIDATRLQPRTKQYMINEANILVKYEILR
jgi:hypothetical protein